MRWRNCCFFFFSLRLHRANGNMKDMRDENLQVNLALRWLIAIDIYP
jgi:hypothetical protein